MGENKWKTLKNVEVKSSQGYDKYKEIKYREISKEEWKQREKENLERHPAYAKWLKETGKI